VTYRPRDFWDERLSRQFDLRGTGETELSLAYNRACYELRREVLDRTLAEEGVDPRGRDVLDAGCGTGFFTAYYLGRGARVTGVDIAPTSIARLRERHKDATFVLADISETPPAERFDLVNAFDVLYHVVDDAKWERALGHLSDAVRPGGALLVTDPFSEVRGLQAHNKSRSFTRYASVLVAHGLEPGRMRPTHVLLNRELGAFRFLNRAPGLLLRLDRMLLALGAGASPAVNKLLIARRAA
jgi:SAM-dependent methyltransferase